jgi:uncharacterized repeat protein (TIGR03803 family)
MQKYTFLVCLVAATVVASGFPGVAQLRNASRLEVLYRFTNPFEEPSSGLVQGPDGALYGTAMSGAAGAAGTVFRLRDGRLTTLHVFRRGEPTPSGSSLVLGSDHTLYGTAGAAAVDPPGGTLFAIDQAGAMSVVHRFTTVSPGTSLIRTDDGHFYGTMYGPSNLESAIYRVDVNGGFTVLRAFAGATEGTPNSLVQGMDGNLYGTTATGGGSLSAGTIFGLSRDGGFALLHTFQRATTAEGAGPRGVIQRADGSLWGTTSRGGGPAVAFLTQRSPDPYVGTIFKLTPDRTLTTLHRFNGSNGAVPLHPLVEAGDGYLYGTTSTGGSYSFGTIFRISPEGQFTVIQEMTEPGEFLPLHRLRDGAIYGTRTGAKQQGAVIFRLSTTR